jgi:hypothetical protein
MSEQNELAKQFEDIFERLLNGKKIDSHQEELSFLLLTIAQNLIDYPLRFEVLTDLTSKRGKSRQIIIEGDILAEEDYGEWNDRLEPFKATVTDKRITKQGIWIKIWVGKYFGEGNLSEIFGLTK